MRWYVRSWRTSEASQQSWKNRRNTIEFSISRCALVLVDGRLFVVWPRRTKTSRAPEKTPTARLESDQHPSEGESTSYHRNAILHHSGRRLSSSRFPIQCRRFTSGYFTSSRVFIKEKSSNVMNTSYVKGQLKIVQ